MKQYSFLFFIALLINLLSSCNKDPEPTVYKGRVLQEKSDRPVPNALIEIKTCKGSFSTGQLSCYTVDSTYTDNDGNFSYPVLGADKYTSLDFFVKKEHFFKDDGTNFFGTGTVEREIRLTPYAWLDLRMVREAPFDERCIEVVGLKLGDFNNGCTDIENFSYLSYDGIYANRGNDSLHIIWTIKRNNSIKEKFSKTLYLIGLDTTHFELKF